MPSFLRVEMPSPESAIALAGYREENLKTPVSANRSHLVMRGAGVDHFRQRKRHQSRQGRFNALEPLWSQEQPIPVPTS